MIRRLYDKFVNRETISYVFFGVLTTLVNWVVYGVLWKMKVDYRVSTAAAWAAAVLFAFVVNKLFVFQSRSMEPEYVFRELVSFVACRGISGVMEMAFMILMVSGLHVNELFSKVLDSAMVLVVNYIFSKLFIFKKQG